MGTTIVKRYPTFEVNLITENSEYLLTYDTRRYRDGNPLTQKDLEEAIISFSTRNAMEDDSPVFSLVILAKEKWHDVLSSNDLIQIKVIPDTTRGEPANPYIMVGLLSEIHKEGEYEEGILLYRITGRAMAKALIDFEVGVIQEVSTVIADIGWLPDDVENGLKFSGKSAAEIAEQLVERFVYEYAQYEFSNGRELKDYLPHSFSSWQDDEALADVTPFVNYEGSIKQFLDDIAAKPFNELFFEYTTDGKCLTIMRPTPFDPNDWVNLHTVRFTSDVVVEESFGKSDNEMFSVYVVQPPNIADFTSMDIGVFPRYNPELIKKYGYKRLDAQNRYLLAAHLVPGFNDDNEESTSTEDEASVQETANEPPSYDDILPYLTENDYHIPETVRTSRNLIYSNLLETFPTMTNALANNILDSIQESTFNRETYNEFRYSTGDEERDREINEERETAKDKLDEYTERLYNWYCENANFYAGDIRVLGNPNYRVGVKVLYDDAETKMVWEFYVESIQHEFSFDNGYTTIIGVTRGLPYGGRDRFRNMWGKSEEFKGGYLGESSLEDLLEQARENQNAENPSGGELPGDNWGEGGAGGGAAMAALARGVRLASSNSIYVFGGGRTQSNPLNGNPIRVDCSSFIWWLYHEQGVSLKGGKTGMTTDTIKTDPRLRTISRRGSSKTAARNQLQRGDFVYWDTYKNDGHVGLYIGDGQFVGAQSSHGIQIASMKSGYWWNKFNGHVLRFNG